MSKRFAAKEAILTALGIGLTGGIWMRDLEVLDDADGRPQVHLRGAVIPVVAELGGGVIHLSAGATRDHVSAIVIVIQAGNPRT